MSIISGLRRSPITSLLRGTAPQKEIDNNGAIPKKRQGGHLRNLLSFNASRNNGANCGIRERQTRSSISSSSGKDISGAIKFIEKFQTNKIGIDKYKNTTSDLKKALKRSNACLEDVKNGIEKMYLDTIGESSEVISSLAIRQSLRQDANLIYREKCLVLQGLKSELGVNYNKIDNPIINQASSHQKDQNLYWSQNRLSFKKESKKTVMSKDEYSSILRHIEHIESRINDINHEARRSFTDLTKRYRDS